MRKRSISRVVVGLSIALFAAGLAPAAANPAGCAGASTGGDWRTYGGTNDGARNQTAGTLDAGTVADADVAWVFDASVEQPGSGAFHNTPVIADGCAYLAANNGWVFKLNADTGALIQKTLVPFGPTGSGTSGTSGTIVSSVAVENGLVYVVLNEAGAPKVVALDQDDITDEQWRTVLDDRVTSFANSSPIVWGDRLFMGISSNEGSPDARGGYAILNAITGQRLGRWYTITDAEYDQGYRGSSIWTTPVVDEDGFVYAGGGNPASKQIEHRYSNALMKIDANDGATLGAIVDGYKGNNDQYYPGLDRQPVCEQIPTDVIWSPTCVQLDLDFGASLNMWEENGIRYVGAMQKSGVYHALYADTMQMAWTQVAGGPCAACNSATSAVDDENVYVVGTPGGVLFAMDRVSGRYRWIVPTADGAHYQSTSVSNGVVYAITAHGLLMGLDAATGAPLLLRSLSADAGKNVANALSSSGPAIARNTLYVPTSTVVIAYR